MKAFAALLFLVVLAPAYAQLDVPVDAKTDLCDTIAGGVLPAWCALKNARENIQEAFSDTSNKLSSAEIESGVTESDTARDVETAILEKDIAFSKERVSKGWANILSLVILLVEIVKVVFYLAQLFIIVHLPYLYVKLLVFTKNKAFNYARGRSRS